MAGFVRMINGSQGFSILPARASRLVNLDFQGVYVGVSKNRGGKPPKMHGENNGKPYEQMDDLGGNTPIFGNTHVYIYIPSDPVKLPENDGSGCPSSPKRNA